MPAQVKPSPSRRGLLFGATATPIVAGLLSPAPTKAAPAKATAASGVLVERLAWAGVKLELGNVSLFIDARAPSADEGAPGPALSASTERRFALVTHAHGDHCDPVALKPILGDRGYLVAHEDSVRLIDARALAMQSVRLYEPVFLSRGVGEFVAWAVPALDGLGSPQVSWVVDGGGRRIIHCGDTAWHGWWWDIARAYGPFDMAFLPINGFRQVEGRFEASGQPMGMTPEQAASAARILKARAVAPIHFGSAGGGPGYVEEADCLARFKRACAELHVDTRVLAPGEQLRI